MAPTESFSASFDGNASTFTIRTPGNMAPTTYIDSQGNSIFISTSQKSRRTDPKSGKAEEGPQPSAGTRKDARKEHDNNHKKHHNKKPHLPIRCEKCNKNFETTEEHTNHFKTSPIHFYCQNCEDIVDFNNARDLRLHYKYRHPLLYCYSCDHHSTSVKEHKAHMKTSSRHFCCQHCENVVDFASADKLRLHYRDRHPLLYCNACDRHFPAVDDLVAHMQKYHFPCNGCHHYFFDPDLLNFHRRICEKLNSPKKEPPKRTIPKPRERNPPNAKTPRNHYATLGISPYSSHDQIVKAAKEMRVKMHPDRLKRQGGLTEEQEKMIDMEAALVGQAADILSDPELRRKYDRKLGL